MEHAPIIGPDPALLTDEQILTTSRKLVALSQRVAGVPGQKVTAEDLAELDPGDRFLFGSLRVAFDVLVAENERRIVVDDERLHQEIAAFLAAESGSDD